MDFNEKTFRKHILAAPDTILLATDLTDTDFLLPHVVAQAKISAAHVKLIHAIVPSDSLPIEAGAIPYIDESRNESRIDRDVRLTMLDLSRGIESHGVSCSAVVRHGFAADVIREEINSTRPTRLIVGTHGRGKLAQVALGSVVNELLGTVDIPIFAIGPHAQAFGEHSSPRKILHPVSLAGDYQKVVSFAIDLARTYKAELILLHVLDSDIGKSINPGRALNWARNALGALVPNAGGLLPPVRTISKCGNLVDEILSTATSTKADWIVLGVDEEFPLLRFRGTTAYKVLAAANCPVLTLCHGPHRVEQPTQVDTRFVIG